MSSDIPPNLRPLRVQLPVPDGRSQTMSRPPLDAPPFTPAHVQKCIKTTVRIQNYEKPQEVLILTSMSSSVDSILSVDPYATNNGNANNFDGGEVDSLSESDFSDFSETSSSEEDEEDGMEEDDGEEMEEDGGENDGGKDEQAVSHDRCNNGNCDRTEMQQERPEVEKAEAPNQGFRMKAYWLRKDHIRENHHGVFTSYIYYAKVLHKADFNWVATGELVAIKATSWRCIRACRNRLSEDFIKEIAALKHVSDWHNAEMPGRPIMESVMDTHILSADTVMSNETHMYIVMPYCDGGDLCERVAEQMRFSEDESRYWFKQILKGLETLQLMKICHRDLSPENLIIMKDKSLVIDFGMCLQIPYTAAGRHLITAQIPCGKLPHMAPELFRKQPFDGHDVDIWAAGTILLFMLTGKRMKNPPLIDRAFEGVDLGVSYDAADLLRKMFRLDPKNRLSLEEIKNHPFVQYEFLCQR